MGTGGYQGGSKPCYRERNPKIRSRIELSGESHLPIYALG